MRKRAQFLVLALLLSASCGKDANQPELASVTGTVTLNNAVVSGATVTFIPEGETAGTGAEGRTDAEGKYRLKYRNGREGVPAGEYKVVIVKYVMPDGSDMRETDLPPIDSGAKPLFPAIYSERDQTTLKKTVPPGGATIDFPLKK